MRAELHFEGYSDDTFGEYNVTQIDRDNCASGDPIVFELTYAAEGLYVVGQYCGSGSGGWLIGVAPHPGIGDGDGPIPDWPISYAKSDRPYSPRLVVEAPNGFFIGVVGEE